MAAARRPPHRDGGYPSPALGAPEATRSQATPTSGARPVCRSQGRANGGPGAGGRGLARQWGEPVAWRRCDVLRFSAIWLSRHNPDGMATRFQGIANRFRTPRNRSRRVPEKGCVNRLPPPCQEFRWAFLSGAIASGPSRCQRTRGFRGAFHALAACMSRPACVQAAAGSAQIAVART